MCESFAVPNLASSCFNITRSPMRYPIHFSHKTPLHFLSILKFGKDEQSLVQSKVCDNFLSKSSAKQAARRELQSKLCKGTQSNSPQQNLTKSRLHNKRRLWKLWKLPQAVASYPQQAVQCKLDNTKNTKQAMHCKDP